MKQEDIYKMIREATKDIYVYSDQILSIVHMIKENFIHKDEIPKPKKPFDNENRDRHYGLRKGDFVKIKKGFPIEKAIPCIVIEYGYLDNNSVYLRDLTTGQRLRWTAEHCELVVKVEDIYDLDKVTIDTKIMHIIP